MSDRFVRPSPGEATAVRFPPIHRRQLDNGLGVWAIPYGGTPTAAVTVIVRRGTAFDPPGQPGLASLTGDLLDEGAGTRDALALADAFGRLGAQLEIDVGPDSLVLSCSALAKVLDPVLELLADVLQRPQLSESDFARVRDLRLGRLLQLSRSAGTAADRAFVNAVFAGHPYGHGAFGTTASLTALGVDAPRDFWRRHIAPSIATVLVTGEIEPDPVLRTVARFFESWQATPDVIDLHAAPVRSDPRILLVDRPGAAQVELRVGHASPPRSTPLYHALVTMNAVVGGQFTSRINRRLREEKGVTYGAHTSFDFRRIAGSFACDTSVQNDAAADAIGDILAELDAIRTDPIRDDELAAARASLTRGYVRSFETASQVARAAAQLVVHGLADETYDRFVPAVESVSAADVQQVAQATLRPAEATAVVVGDREVIAPGLERLPRTLTVISPEF
jgi:zinc protease